MQEVENGAHVVAAVHHVARLDEGGVAGGPMVGRVDDTSQAQGFACMRKIPMESPTATMRRPSAFGEAVATLPPWSELLRRDLDRSSFLPLTNRDDGGIQDGDEGEMDMESCHHRLDRQRGSSSRSLRVVKTRSRLLLFGVVALSDTMPAQRLSADGGFSTIAYRLFGYSARHHEARRSGLVLVPELQLHRGEGQQFRFVHLGEPAGSRLRIFGSLAVALGRSVAWGHADSAAGCRVEEGCRHLAGIHQLERAASWRASGQRDDRVCQATVALDEHHQALAAARIVDGQLAQRRQGCPDADDDAWAHMLVEVPRDAQGIGEQVGGGNLDRAWAVPNEQRKCCPRYAYGLMSTTGVPSTASSGSTWRVEPSRPTSLVTQSPRDSGAPGPHREHAAFGKSVTKLPGTRSHDIPLGRVHVAHHNDVGEVLDAVQSGLVPAAPRRRRAHRQEASRRAASRVNARRRLGRLQRASR